MIPYRFSLTQLFRFATSQLGTWRKQQRQQLDRIENQLTHMGDALTDMQAAAQAAIAKLESVANNVVALRAQVTALQSNTTDPAAVEAVAQQLNAELAAVETKLGTPAS